MGVHSNLHGLHSLLCGRTGFLGIRDTAKSFESCVNKKDNLKSSFCPQCRAAIVCVDPEYQYAKPTFPFIIRPSALTQTTT